MAVPAPLVAFIVIVLIGGLAYWIRSMVSLPSPAGKIVDVILVVVLVLALVFYVLLPMLGGIRVS